MNLTNFDFLDELKIIKNRLNVTEVSINYKLLDRREDIKIGDGDIELNNASDWNKNVTLDSKTGAMLDSFGNIIIVYIKDNTRSDLKTGIEYLKKVHITWCEILEKMEKNGRYDRYVATKNQNDLYLVDLAKDSKNAPDIILKDETRNLHPCQYCLSKTKIEGFDYGKFSPNERKEFVSNFKMKSWFSYCNENGIGNKFLGSRKTRYTDQNAPEFNYTADWEEISKNYRKSKNWTCEKCKMNCSENKKNLDTHHINGVKSDNRTVNLKALCKNCHSKEPMHGKNRGTF